VPGQQPLRRSVAGVLVVLGDMKQPPFSALHTGLRMDILRLDTTDEMIQINHN
jgi:hypothetical protein